MDSVRVHLITAISAATPTDLFRAQEHVQSLYHSSLGKSDEQYID